MIVKPRFAFKPSKLSNICKFLIHWMIFMKFVQTVQLHTGFHIKHKQMSVCVAKEISGPQKVILHLYTFF